MIIIIKNECILKILENLKKKKKIPYFFSLEQFFILMQIFNRVMIHNGYFQSWMFFSEIIYFLKVLESIIRLFKDIKI